MSLSTRYIRTIRRRARALVLSQDWWERMTPEAKERYLQEHPRSEKSSGGAREEKISYESTTLEQRLAKATYDDVKNQMQRNLQRIQTKEPKFHSVSGSVSSNLENIEANANSLAESYHSYLAPECRTLMSSYVDMSLAILRSYPNEFSKIEAQEIDSLIRDGVDKLVHQEIESNRQQFTDHGIRHVVKNLEMQQSILLGFEKSGQRISGRKKLSALVAMLNHDVGYTASSVRQGGIDGIKASSEHKLYSRRIMEEQRSKWNEDRIFSPKEFDEVLDLIETHDSTNLDDPDPVKLATRVSDNFALFHSEKLPSMFKYVPNSTKLLIEMGKAAKDKNTDSFENSRRKLYQAIDSTNLNANLKRDLKMGTREIGMLTPKFTLGILAGETEDVSVDTTGKIDITIRHNKYDSFLQKHFDLGQKQMKKVLSDYGITDFSQSEYDLGKVKVKVI